MEADRSTSDGSLDTTPQGWVVRVVHLNEIEATQKGGPSVTHGVPSVVK